MLEPIREDTGRSTPPAWSRIGAAARFQGPGPFAAAAGGVDLVLVRTAEGLRAFQGLCPHQGALLGEGAIEGGALVCRNHRWRFRLSDGCREGGWECLRSYPLREEAGELFADLSTAEAVSGTATEAVAPALREVADLPGPKGLPLFGNSLQLDLAHLHQQLERWAVEHGPLYRCRVAGLQVVVVSDPGLNERILRARPEGFGRLPTVAPVFREMGVEGVFSAEGAAWRPQRRLAMQALAPRHLRGFYPVLVTIAERLRERWRRAVEAGVEIDLLDDLKRFTVDVTTLLTLGRDLDTLGRDEDVIQRHLEHLMPAFNRRLFALLPTWRWLPLPADRRLDRALKALHAWLAEVIAEARQRLVAHPQPEPANFLEAMLTARDERDRPFSDLEIAGNLLTMLLAGEDTTAYTLAWAVHHLCEAPAAVAALRAELDEALGPAAVPPTSRWPMASPGPARPPTRRCGCGRWRR